MIGTAVVIVVAAVGGGAYLIKRASDKKKQEATLKCPKCYKQFQESMISYVNALSNENLKEKDIDLVIEKIQNIKDNEAENSDKLTNQTVLDVQLGLADMIKDYTEQFYKANHFEADLDSYTETNSLERINHYLKLQKKLYHIYS